MLNYKGSDKILLKSNKILMEKIYTQKSALLYFIKS